MPVVGVLNAQDKFVQSRPIVLVPIFPKHMCPEILTVLLYLVFFLHEQIHWLHLCLKYPIQEIIKALSAKQFRALKYFVL